LLSGRPTLSPPSNRRFSFAFLETFLSEPLWQRPPEELPSAAGAWKFRWARKEQDLRACHILFVSRSEGKRYESIFKSIQGANVLTVGETPDFLASGGAIDFLIAEDRLQFEVNIGAASDAHLRISSNMLALARHVITRAEAAKSFREWEWKGLEIRSSNVEVKP
jgi:hypothetical protein